MASEKIKLDDLYFGVMCRRMNYSSEDKNKPLLEQYNLFNFSRVKHSVAMWVVMDKTEQKQHDFLRWCFGDTWGRCEFEMIISDWPYKEDALLKDVGEKYDIFELYVKPNAALLEDMVSRVSKNSAQVYLREYRKKFNKGVNK